MYIFKEIKHNLNKIKMKIYLKFSICGDITELKTKDNIFYKDNYDNYKLIENISYNNKLLILLFNNDTSQNKNITVLPFYDNIIYGDFILFLVDQNDKLKNFNETKFLKLLNKFEKVIEDYSSDDFNLSDD